MRMSPLRLLEVTGAVIVALLAPALPMTTAYLVLRSMLVVATLVWFGWIVMQVTGMRPARRANLGAHASSQQ
jgi:hypothetical protein